MREFTYAVRDWVLGTGYRWLVKPLLFAQDPETVHHRMTAAGQRLGRSAVLRRLVRWSFDYDHPMLRTTLAGIPVRNPIGLAAGFDKEGVLTDILPSVGFGFTTIGSITGSPTPGNPKPRLWRLPKSRALVVHMGLNSTGSAAIGQRFRGKEIALPVAVSIAKANIPAVDGLPDGIADYVRAAGNLREVGAFWEINISCPNTTGGEPFLAPERLEQLLSALAPYITARPTFIKLPSGLLREQLNDVLAVAQRGGVTGFTCTNLLKDHAHPNIIDASVPLKGGISGKVLESTADEVLSYVYQRTGGRMPLIGVGGVFTAEDAYKKIRLGASVVELITGMIYRGPSAISEMKRGLVRLARRDGFSSISEAVGADHR